MTREKPSRYELLTRLDPSRPQTRAERILGGQPAKPASAAPPSPQGAPFSRMAKKAPGKGRPVSQKDARGMNRLEARYADWLDLEMQAGRVIGWWFEPFSVRLGPNTYYRPDFLVQMADATLEIHETKGKWEDDARAKTKIFAGIFPCFRVLAIQWKAKAWVIEELTA